MSTSLSPQAGGGGRKGHPPKRNPPSRTSKGSKKKPALLLVDDEPLVLEVTEEMLAYLGFHVLTATNGEEGLAVFEAEEKHLAGIVTNREMPFLNGRELCAKIRESRKRLPILVVSGFPEAIALRRFPKDPYRGFLQKPFTLETLAHALKTLGLEPKYRREHK